MPLTSHHLRNLLKDSQLDKEIDELTELMVKRINQLCFEDCQIDRIACTLQPKCRQRWLLKLRMLNKLTLEDMPKFCYSVHKNIIFRDYHNKTVVYKPTDAYLYTIDFLDVMFHGDYRKLNQYYSKKQFRDCIKIFKDRINNRDEHFQYLLSDKENFMIFKFEEKIHVMFLNENYVLSNANRDNITSVELLKGICELFARLYFPEFKLQLGTDNRIEIKSIIPEDILLKISKEPPETKDDKIDDYFWNFLSSDLDALSQHCKEINLYINKQNDLIIKIHLDVNSSDFDRKNLLRYRDLRLIFNIIFRFYNDFYIIWA